MTLFLKKYWLVILIILLAFLLRVYRLEELFYFTYDESVPAFVGRRLILFHHIPLIGGVTPFGVHLAPYFYWLLSFLLWIGNLNPIIWGVAGAFLAIFTTLMMYLVGKEIRGNKLGIIASVFWVFSYLANVYDRHFWALYWGPLLSLVVIYSLLKIIKGKERFVYLLAIALAFGIHVDLSNYIFLILAGSCWIFYKIRIQKSTFLAIGIIALSFLPLLIFDLRHNFANIGPGISHFQQKKEVKELNLDLLVDNTIIFPRTFVRLIYPFGFKDINLDYTYCLNYINERDKTVPYGLILISIIILTFFIYKSFKQKDSGVQILSFLILIYLMGISIYGLVIKNPVYEHYITGLFPAFLIILGLLLYKLPIRVMILILAFFALLNLSKLLTVENSMGLKNKKQAINYAMSEVKDKNFSLDSLSSCWKYNGYRYLFSVFGNDPVKSYVDPSLAYLYEDKQVLDKHPETVVSFVVHDFNPETVEFNKRYKELKEKTFSSKQFGRIEVLIIDNKTGFFDQIK